MVMVMAICSWRGGQEIGERVLWILGFAGSGKENEKYGNQIIKE